MLWLITWAGFLAIRLIGPTLRVTVSFEDGAPPSLDTRPMVLAFWHNCIFPATYIWRNLQIRVMSSDSFDGEWTGRIIRKFGFVKVRGSSSRGAVRALLGMRRELEQGWPVAFTIDGPRGPRFVAKPGPVLLARATRSAHGRFSYCGGKSLDSEYLGQINDSEAVFASLDASEPPNHGAGGCERFSERTISCGIANRAGASARIRGGKCRKVSED